MKKLISRVACVALVFAMAMPAMAQKDDKDGAAKPAAKAKAEGKAEAKAAGKADAKEAGGKKRAAVANPLIKAVGELKLTAEQKPKVEEISNEFTETILALRKEGLNQELQKKKADAAKAARESGKKGRELEAAVMATIKATDEEKAILKKAEEATAKMQKGLAAVLTADQIATLPPQMQQSLGVKKTAEKKPADGEKKPADKKKAA